MIYSANIRRNRSNFLSPTKQRFTRGEYWVRLPSDRVSPLHRPLLPALVFGAYFIPHRIYDGAHNGNVFRDKLGIRRRGIWQEERVQGEMQKGKGSMCSLYYPFKSIAAAPPRKCSRPSRVLPENILQRLLPVILMERERRERDDCGKREVSALLRIFRACIRKSWETCII